MREEGKWEERLTGDRGRVLVNRKISGFSFTGT
jgi:hypothetical protein